MGIRLVAMVVFIAITMVRRTMVMMTDVVANDFLMMFGAIVTIDNVGWCWCVESYGNDDSRCGAKNNVYQR